PVQLAEQVVEGPLQLLGRLVRAGGDLLADRLDLLVADLRQAVDAVEHQAELRDLDLVPRGGRGGGRAGLDAEGGEPGVDRLRALWASGAVDFHDCVSFCTFRGPGRSAPARPRPSCPAGLALGRPPPPWGGRA